MADYYTSTVIQPDIPAAAMTPIERLVLTQAFEWEEVDGSIYFYAADSVNTMLALHKNDVCAALAASDAAPCRIAERVREALAEASVEVADLDIDLDDWWQVAFQDIIVRTAELEHVTITAAWTCSRMRVDGFGGSVTVITAEQVLAANTADMEYELLNRAEFGDLGCAPGHGEHVVLRLAEKAVREQVVHIQENPLLEPLEVSDEDVRQGCLDAIARANLDELRRGLIFEAAKSSISQAGARSA